MRDKQGKFIKGSYQGFGFKKNNIPWNKSKQGLQIPWNKGIHLSEEIRKKLSLSHLGNIPWNKDKKLHYQVWMKGRHHSKNSKLKNRLAHLGKKHTEETKNRMCGRIGKKSHSWKGGIISNGEYIYIYKPFHPLANKKYVKRANLIMEKYLGRYLKPGEIVHHIDKNKLNDSIENLELFPNKSEHTRFHHLISHNKQLI